MRLAVKVMRESRKTWRSVITFQASAASSLKECFYCVQSNGQHHSATMIIWPKLVFICSSLKVGSRPRLLLKCALNASV